MPLTIDWVEIARRLAFAMLAGIVFGLNRDERGRAAGLRTTILVSLAAALAMVETNLLLPTLLTASDRYAVFDPMRLPLGILTGMGFIGAGAILRHGDRIQGVTTAATLWLVTMIGLCFGSGQAGLGLAAVGIGAVVLWCLRWLELVLKRERTGIVTLTVRTPDSGEDNLDLSLASMGFRIISWTTDDSSPQIRKLRGEIHWRAAQKEVGLPQFVTALSERSDVLALEWQETYGGEK